MHDLNQRQRRLRPRPVAAARRRRGLGRLATAAALGRRPEERAGARGQLLLEALELQLELRLRAAGRRGERPRELDEAPVEPRVLGLQEQRHLPQPLEVRLRREPHHRTRGISLC